MNGFESQSLWQSVSRATRRWFGPSRAGRVQHAAGRAASFRVDALEARTLMAGDHPSYADYPTSTNVALTSGSGSVTGVIEASGQDDLFRFTATANQFYRIGATASGPLDPRLEIYTGAAPGTRVYQASSYLTRPDPLTNTPDATNVNAVIGFVATAGTTYYVRVMSDQPSGSPATGSYTLTVASTDSATDSPVAPVVTLNGQGEGSQAGTISVSGDADLYQFTTATSDFTTVYADSLNAGGSTLDNSLEIYDTTTGALVVSATGNSTLTGTQLTGGTTTDAWTGFISQAGRAYLARVFGSSTPSGSKTSTGNYTLRVDAVSTSLTTGQATYSQAGTLGGGIGLLQDDVVFRMTNGTAANFASVVSVNATTAGALDSRLEIYDSNGVLLRQDSESGFATNAFTTFLGAASGVYFIRVRSDEVTAVAAATGNFTLSIRAVANAITLDPVTRQGSTSGNIGGTLTNMVSFVAQGTGTAILTFQGAGLPPLSNPTLHLYDDTGVEIASSTDYAGAGLNSQIAISLTGGRTYFALLEGFDVGTPGGSLFAVETNHTFTAGVIDDHANFNDFANATSVVWNYTPRSAPNYFSGGSLLGSVGGTGATIASRNRVIIGTVAGRIHSAGDEDVFTFTPPVDMLSDYAGKQDPAITTAPLAWLLNHRPGTQLQFFLATGSGYLANPLVRIYDSTGAQIYSSSTGFVGANQAGYPQGGPAVAAADRASYNPNQVATAAPNWAPSTYGPQVWGGEEYFIVVSGDSEGTYELALMVDGLPASPVGSTGAYTDNGVSTIREIPNAGQFSSAIDLSINSGTGDSFYNGGASGTYPANPAGVSTGFERDYRILGAPGSPIPFDPFAAGSGTYILQESGLAGIEHPLDTDLYRFRAPFSGYAEVRILTTGLSDFYSEFITDGEADPANPVASTTVKNKTYNSPLDSALRAFAADQQEIGFNNDNPAIAGSTGVEFIGSSILAQFQRRDGRIVIPIVANQTYYLQVESGQRSNYQQFLVDGVTNVDWRRVTGSYRIMVHTLPNLGFTDDHTDADPGTNPNEGASSVIGINSNPLSSANGTGSITGIIQNNVSNPSDTDLFTFIAPARGTATLTLSRATGSAVIGTASVYDTNFNTVIEGTANTSGLLTLTFPAAVGDRFYIVVSGATTTGGGYTLALSGLPFTDDHADFGEFFVPTSNPDNRRAPTSVTLLDFQGVGSAAGNIESPGDTDVFQFQATSFQSITVTISSTALTMNPFVTIYEQNLDGSIFLTGANAQAPLYRIAFNDNAGNNTTNSQVTFSVSNSRTSRAAPNGNGRTYNNYYIVVRGSDQSSNYGAYTVSIGFTPTDDYPDANSNTTLETTDQFAFAPSLVVDSAAGAASFTGITETTTDTDVVQFTAPAGGFAIASITRQPGTTSTIVPRISILQVSGSTVTLVAQGTAQDLGFGVFLAGTTPNFNVTRGGSYYAVVENTGGTRGEYRVTLSLPAVDDHPNIGEFSIATSIPLSSATGDGELGSTAGAPDTPRLAPTGDSDLFIFTTLGTGVTTITISVLSDFLAPKITLFDSTTAQIGSPVSATASNQTISITTGSAPLGTTYYILIQAAPAGATQFGDYKIAIDGPLPPDTGGGGGGGNGAIDFNNPTIVPLNSSTGNASISDQIDASGDRDLFSFTTPAAPNGKPRRIFVQLVTPTGSTLSASVTILSAPNETSVVATDSAGIPGVEAATSFVDTGGGNTYYALVDGIGNAVGSYTLRIDAQPINQQLFYPEGYASDTVREFVSIGNANTYAVSYSVVIRYETGELGGVVSTGTIPAGSRGGVTLSDGTNGPISGLRSYTPYSVIIESDGPLAATLAHYDFGVSVGDSFSEQASTRHDFARIERLPGSVFDFLVYYNPNSIDVRVTVTAYSNDGSPVSFSNVVGAGRRGGVNINDVPNFPVGVFSASVTVAPADGSTPASDFRGVVASLSHYDQAGGTGYGYISSTGGGSTKGSVPSLTNGDTSTAELVIFNPGNQQANVTLTGTYIRTPSLPTLTRSIDIAPGKSVRLVGSQLNFVANQPIGLSYSSNVPIVAHASETQQGDANATNVATDIGTAYYFGDAFINTTLAGQLYFETLSFSNPTAIDTVISIRLLFSDSDVVTITQPIAARGYAQVRLHELDEIIVQRPGLNYFSIEASASIPFASQLTHADLFLGGVWTTEGVPYGLTNSIAAIP
jgi:hypothetical protein